MAHLTCVSSTRDSVQSQIAKIREAGCFLYRASFPNGLTEYEYDHVFTGEYSGPFTPNPEEIAELRFVSLPALKQDMLEHPERYAVWFFTALGIAEAGRR